MCAFHAGGKRLKWFRTRRIVAVIRIFGASDFKIPIRIVGIKPLLIAMFSQGGCSFKLSCGACKDRRNEQATLWPKEPIPRSKDDLLIFAGIDRQSMHRRIEPALLPVSDWQGPALSFGRRDFRPGT